MKIRPLHRSEREALLDLLDGWELDDGWRGRDFFGRLLESESGRLLESEPRSEENIWVAADSGELVSCAQIFPRRIRVLGHPVPTGGVGGVFTRAERRRSGTAGELLRCVKQAMHERGFELSLLFAPRPALFGELGWEAWKCQRSVLRLARGGMPGPEFAKRRGDLTADLELTAFEPGRDLEAVKAIHSAYSATRSGTVVRDDLDWEMSLRLAGNPDEQFRVARRAGSAVAYLRATILHSTFTVTELARLDDGSGALAELVVEALTPREDDPMAGPKATSAQVRSSVLLPAFDDLPLTVGLEQRGVTSHPIDEPSAMLLCLNARALAARLDVSLLPGETNDAFLTRILPRDSLVFWPADRW